MKDFFDMALPIIISILSGTGTIFLVILIVQLGKKFGLDREQVLHEIERAKKGIEAGDREALHWALETAARLAVSRGLIGQSAIDFVLRYVGRSTPEAINNLRPSPTTMKDLVESKLIEAAKGGVEGAIKRSLERSLTAKSTSS